MADIKGAPTDRAYIIREAAANLARGISEKDVIARWHLCETELRQARDGCISLLETEGMAKARAEYDDRRDRSRSDYGGY